MVHTRPYPGPSQHGAEAAPRTVFHWAGEDLAHYAQGAAWEDWIWAGVSILLHLRQAGNVRIRAANCAHSKNVNCAGLACPGKNPHCWRCVFLLGKEFASLI